MELEWEYNTNVIEIWIEDRNKKIQGCGIEGKSEVYLIMHQMCKVWRLPSTH